MAEILGPLDPIFVVYVGVAVGVLLAFTGAAQLVSRREHQKDARSRRLRLIAEGRTTLETLELLKPKPQSGVLSKLPLLDGLPGHLRQAGLSISAIHFLLLCLGFSLALSIFLLGWANQGLALFAGAFFGFVVPLSVVRLRSRKRTEALIAQLPDALDTMARGLRVGHPLNATIGSIAQDMPDPVGTEFGIIYDQVSYGDELPDAFQDFAERANLEDIYYLSASIGIQHGTGGDLANVIEILGKVVRDRIAMRKKIRAISSEGRLSAWFLSSLPVLIFVFTSIMTPGYYGDVATDPLFKPMAMVVIVLTLLNLLILKKLVEFRI